MPDREQNAHTMESHLFPGKTEEEDRNVPGRREPRGHSGNERNLSPEREEELWRRLSSQGDEDARDEIIVAYRPLVFWLARKFRVRPSSYQDLIQEGMVELNGEVCLQRTKKIRQGDIVSVNGESFLISGEEK